jgi:hypothetical protein
MLAWGAHTEVSLGGLSVPQLKELCKAQGVKAFVQGSPDGNNKPALIKRLLAKQAGVVIEERGRLDAVALVPIPFSIRASFVL